MDGRAVSDGSATASMTLNSGSTLLAETLGVAHGSVLLNGFVMVNVSTLNLTDSGSLDGTGRSGYTSTLGPGTPATSGCTWPTNDNGRDRAASHGGVGGGASAGCAYGSTFFPLLEGSSGYGGRGGAALRLSVAGELWLDGTECE